MRHRQPLFSRAADALQVLVGDESRHVESAPSDSAIVERLDALDASLAEVLDGVKPVRRPFPFGVVVGAVVAVALVVGGSVLVLRANTDRNRAARSVDFAVAEVSFFETAAAADAAWIDKRAEALRDQTQLMATMLAYKESLEPDEQERAAGLIELVSGGEEGADRQRS
jgi:hypothetical protein